MKLIKILFIVPLKKSCINLFIVGNYSLVQGNLLFKGGWFFPSIASLSLSCFMSITTDY